MHAIKSHLALRKPRFICRDVEQSVRLTVDLKNSRGRPATKKRLAQLQRVAPPEAYPLLLPLYNEFDGLVFHQHGSTAGLVVATIPGLEQLNAEWGEWFAEAPATELHEYQRHGFAFATIAASGNYFIICSGGVYYSDHDGGDDGPWAPSLDAFFERALGDPVKFLNDAGCYTRYSDGRTRKQFIPISFEHA